MTTAYNSVNGSGSVVLSFLSRLIAIADLAHKSGAGSGAWALVLSGRTRNHSADAPWRANTRPSGSRRIAERRSMSMLGRRLMALASQVVGAPADGTRRSRSSPLIVIEIGRASCRERV